MTFKKTAETLEPGAHTLEREYYTSSDVLQKEYENLFLNNWICAGRSMDLAENGQYKVIKIDTESVIVLRDENGELKAHYNVCRHRGTRICKNESGQFSKSIQCGYHGWTYNLKGKLIGAPHMDAVDGFDKKITRFIRSRRQNGKDLFLSIYLMILKTLILFLRP